MPATQLYSYFFTLCQPFLLGCLYRNNDPNHRCPQAVSTPPLTFSLHSPQLQLCCCVGQVLFHLEQLILLNFALPLQLIHLHKEITNTKVFLFLLAQKVDCTGQWSDTQPRTKVETITSMEQMLDMFKCHFSDLDLVSYLISQQQVFLTGSRQVMQKLAFPISTFLQTEAKLKTCTPPSSCTTNLCQPTSHPAKSDLHHK